MLFSKLIYFSWKSTASVLPTLRGIRGFSRFATIHENNSNGSDSRISIGIVGTGAIGSYYGARLWERRDLYNVKFHMRSAENFDACQDHGLQVKSIHGDIFIPPSDLQAYRTTDEMGKVDWVVLALKSSALPCIPTLVKPLLRKKTRVLAIMNGLIDDDLVELLRTISLEENDVATKEKRDLPCAAVYGGMAFIGANRLRPGFVEHSDEGSLLGGIAAISKPEEDEEEELKALVELWKPTKVKFTEERLLIRGRWIKNCWNLPFNSVSCAMGGTLTIDKIVRDPSLRKLANDIMDETIAIANADLASRGVSSSMLLGDQLKTQMWLITDKMGPYKTSTMLDLLQRRPMEVKYLFRRPLEIAENLNIAAPKLEALTLQIEGLQRHYGLF